MGTVHAKSAEAEDGGDDGGGGGSNKIDLQGLKARVQRVHISGLGRTKEDIVISSVEGVFEASDFQTVIVKIHEARTRLEDLGCFKGVGVLIDTYDGQDALKEGIQVTFEVEENKLLGARLSTSVGHNSGSVNSGAVLRNLFGRGEELSAHYSYGNKRNTSFGITMMKPFHNQASTKWSSSLHQDHSEAGWSGYKELSRGASTGIVFQPVPDITQQFVVESVWRQLSCLSKSTAFAVREQCGHTLKNSVRHEITLDTRDDPIFPTDGHKLKLKTEFAGLGGNVGFLKNEASLQANVPLPFGLVAQASVAVGHLLPLSQGSSHHTISDRFILGGPMGLRGFQMAGAGPHSEGYALGADMFWSAGVHVFAPLPLLPHGSFTDRFRLHAWTNTGTTGNWSFERDVRRQIKALTQDMRLSCGAGVALNLLGLARAELNYCVPLLSSRGDRTDHGVQFGLAADVL